MSIITLTPSGMVESGEDFHGNCPVGYNAYMEKGVSFEGNSPVSTPTASANKVICKMDPN